MRSSSSVGQYSHCTKRNLPKWLPLHRPESGLVLLPRGNAPEDARREFAAAVQAGVSPQTIIDKAGGYARKIAAEGTETRYIKQPANWLKDKRCSTLREKRRKKQRDCVGSTLNFDRLLLQHCYQHIISESHTGLP